MHKAWRRRTTWAIAGSTLAHLAVLVVVLLQRPTLPPPAYEPAGPPQPIIPILLMPRTPPEPAGGVPHPNAVRLHQRPPRNPSAPAPVAPLLIPPPKPADLPAQGAPAARATAPPAPPPAPSEAVRATLRTTLGCAEAQATGLSQSERERCAERLGRGAREAAYLAPALSPAKRAALDQEAATREARKASIDRPIPPGANRAEPADYDGEPYTSGAGAPDPHSSMPHTPSTRAARKLGRLPP
ncbi:hypothetical protein [Phenylobacterium sp.]|uniref:hypothetical protein n=1 Tax=Phenylobacterium sp. TaxID=1871053 RepID=UPI00286A82DF|nr:hypothetical protein [Phenylobacterium sp.]